MARLKCAPRRLTWIENFRILRFAFWICLGLTSLYILDVKKAYGYGAGARWDSESVHQWIVEKALDYALRKEGGSAGKYRDLLIWNSGHLVNFLKSGVWRADNSTLKCSWSLMFIEVESDDCDSLHHYGKYGAIETNLGADGANPGELIAPVYADGLYEVAKKFWPGGEPPTLEGLRYVDAGYIMTTGLDVFYTDLMNTYIGGLPHCEKHFYEMYFPVYFQRYCEEYWYSCYTFPAYVVSRAQSAAYRDAKETCPVWPPGIAIDSQGKQTVESIENAFSYLGWALHMIQDLTVPHHSLNKATLDHSDWEASITDLWRQGRFDHLPLDTNHTCWAGRQPQYTDIYEYARAVTPKDFALSIRDTTIDCANILGYTNQLREVLLDLAIKASAALIEKFFNDIGPVHDDILEENDHWYQVRFLDAGRYLDLVVFPQDDDWYRFYVPSDYSDIVIDVIYHAPLADNWPWLWPWLIVHESTGDHAVGGQRTAYGKRIELKGAKAGYYELHVEASIPLRYELVISITQGPLPEDIFEQWEGNDTPENPAILGDLIYYEGACYEDLNIHQPGDEDYYSFPLPQGDWRFETSITYDPRYGRVHLSVNGKEPWVRVMNADGTETARIGMCLSDGSALIRIWGARNYYRLCVEKNEDPTCGNIPKISVNPASLLFGTYTVGTHSGWRTIKISNEGRSNLYIRGMSLTNSESFELSTNEGEAPCGSSEVSLPPGASCTAAVRFKPQTASKFRGALEIISNDPVLPNASLSLQGAGAIIRITSPQLWLYKCHGEMTFHITYAASPYFIDWGICYQTKLPWGPPGPVLCSYDFLLPDSFQIQYGDNSIFLRVEGCVPDDLVGLWIRVEDARGIEGIKDIEIVVPEPDISVSHTSIDFGTVTVGPFGGGGAWPTAVKTLNILNTGTGPLQLNISLEKGQEVSDIEISHNCPQKLEPYGTCKVDASYSPTVEGEAREVLRITTDDPDERELNVELKGYGVRRPQLSYMVFGDPIEVGLGGRGFLRVNVWNTGSGILGVNQVSLLGSPDFWIDQNTCTEPLSYYPSFGSCYILIGFSPSTTGISLSSLVIESTDTARSPLTIPISGRGISPFVATSVSSLDFAEAGKRLCFEIQNTSGSSLLSWNLGSNFPSWLRASETEGMLGPSKSKNICLFVDRSNLNASTSYEHMVILTSNGGIVSIPVSIIVPMPLTTFAKYYGGCGDEYFAKIRTTSDGGFIAVGLTTSFGAGSLGEEPDAWVVKMDGSGYVEWAKSYGSYYVEKAYDVRETADGGFVVAAGTSGFTTEGQYGLWILKLDAHGDLEWEKVYETTLGSDYNGGKWGEEFSVHVLDEGFVVAGNVWGWGGLDAWVLKLRIDGEIEWERTYGTWDRDSGTSFGVTSDGGYLIAGTTLVYEGGEELMANLAAVGNSICQQPLPSRPHSDIWVLRLGRHGEIQWEKRYGTEFNDVAHDIKETSDGGVVVIGTSFSTISALVLKLNSNGNIEWKRSYGGCDNNYYGAYGHSIKETSDGGFIFTGVLSSRVSGDQIWLVKLDSRGNVEWERTYGGNGVDMSYSVDEIPGGGYVIAGFTTSFRSQGGSTQYDALVIRVDSKGNLGGCEIVGLPSTGATDTAIVSMGTASRVGLTGVGVYETVATTSVQDGKEVAGVICEAFSYTLTVVKEGNGSGQITSQPSGIYCGEDCEEPFLPNTQVLLVATPVIGSSFSGWSGDCTTTNGNQAHVFMDSDKTCIATFSRLSGPDLLGAWGRLMIRRGSAVMATLRVKNVGNEPTANGFWVSFYMSTDDTLDDSDRMIGRFFVNQILRPGAQRVIPLTYFIDKPIKGGYVLAIVDSMDQILELDETNNVSILSLTR